MKKEYNKGQAFPKETRLKIYKKLLEMYNSGEAYKYTRGLCFLAKDMVEKELDEDDEGYGVYIDEHPYLLPELYELRAKDWGSYWYSSDQERIEALKKAIKLLAKAL